MNKQNFVFYSGMLVSSVLLSGFLSSCEESPNPLLVENIEDIAQIISAAEQVAMQETKIFYTSGSIYRACHNKPQNFAPLQPISEGIKQCDLVFAAIAKAARKNPGFENLSINNLKDQKAFDRIQAAMVMVDGG